MRWDMEHGEVYVKTSRTQGQDRLNSTAAPPKEFKESLEEILSYMVFAQIQMCTSFFHEMRHACACVRPRVQVSIHRAVSVAPLAEKYRVFAASECSMCHGRVRGLHAANYAFTPLAMEAFYGCVRLRHMFRHPLARTAIIFGSTRSIAEFCLFTKIPHVARWCTST